MTQKANLLLIRHGETAWNVLEKAQGHQDISLNENGILQSEVLASLIKHQYSELTAIYSSDLARAHQTAQAIARAFSLPILKHSGLRELSFGEAEGLTFSEISLRYGDTKKELDEKFPCKKDRWKVTEIPGAETLESAFHRFTTSLQAIGMQHAGQTCAVITHGKLLKILLTEIQSLDIALHIPNCALIPISYCPISGKLTTLHESLHL